MEIRPFNVGDEMQCSEILYDSFEWYLHLPNSEWFKNKISPEHILDNSKRGYSFVALDEDGIAGYINFTISDYKVAYLSIIGVHSNKKLRKIGFSLMNEMEKSCKEMGVRKIWLMVSHININAINFYLRLGYNIEGYLTNMTIEGIHEIILAKHL